MTGTGNWSALMDCTRLRMGPLARVTDNPRSLFVPFTPRGHRGADVEKGGPDCSEVEGYVVFFEWLMSGSFGCGVYCS